MRYRRFALGSAMLACLGLTAAPTRPQAIQKPIDVHYVLGPGEKLRGLVGVSVLVEGLKDDVEKDGLSKDDIQTDVELRLRTAGIKVLTQEETFKTPGMPKLYVRVGTLKDKERPTYTFTADIELHEAVMLNRGECTTQEIGGVRRAVHRQFAIVGATTWKTPGLFGLVGLNRLSSVRDEVKNMVDKFCNDYLRANPKK